MGRLPQSAPFAAHFRYRLRLIAGAQDFCKITAMNDHPGRRLSVTQERIAPLLEQARAADVDIDEMVQSLNLDPEIARPAKGRTISLADYYRFQNRLAILSGDETLHLSSRQLLPGSTDFVLQHVADCDTLYDAMRIVARSYNILHGGQFNAVVKRRAAVEYIIDDRNFSYAPDVDTEYRYFSIESILIFLHCMLIIISPIAEDAITALQIRRPSPGGDCAHLAYWNAPIKFGAETYKVLFNRDAALSRIAMPPPEALTSNAVYQKIVDVVAGKHEEIERQNSVSSRVRDALARGIVEQADVAAQMAISVATLRRRLAQEGVSFRELRRAVLNETAKRLLAEERSMAEISETLGFSEIRAFSRAFKDWNGVTPTAFVSQSKPS